MSFRVVDLAVLLEGGYRMCDYSGEERKDRGENHDESRHDRGGHDDCCRTRDDEIDDQDPTIHKPGDDEEPSDRRDTLGLLREQLHRSLEV